MQPPTSDLPHQPPRKQQKVQPPPVDLTTLPLSAFVSGAPPPILDASSADLSPVHPAKLAGFRAAVAARGAALILLAAGQGSRFVASVPKVVHPFTGKPLARHAMDAAASAGLPAVVVVGYQRETVARRLAVQEKEQVVYVRQERQMGTGHAVYLGTFALPKQLEADVVVSYADNPGVDQALLEEVLAAHERNKRLYGDSYAAMVLTGSRKAAGRGAEAYGRIVREKRDGSGPIVDIVEKKTIAKIKEAGGEKVYAGVRWTGEELEAIDEFNSGIVVARGKAYVDVLKGMLAHRTKTQPDRYEYYATDFVKGLAEKGMVSEGYKVPEESMWKLEGANTVDELRALERRLVERDAVASAGKTAGPSDGPSD